MFSLRKGTNSEQSLISNKSFHHKLYNLLLLRSIHISFRRGNLSQDQVREFLLATQEGLIKDLLLFEEMRLK